MDKLVHKPLKIPGKKVIVTKRMVEDAIERTKSQTQAAKWIGVAYKT